MATVSPPQLDMSESSRRDVTIVADKHPIVWKAFTTDAEHFKLRPGAGVLRPKEAATAVASINKRLDKVAARIAVKRLTPQEFADYTKMTGSDSAKKTWDNCLGDVIKYPLPVTLTPTAVAPVATAGRVSPVVHVFYTLLILIAYAAGVLSSAFWAPYIAQMQEALDA